MWFKGDTNHPNADRCGLDDFAAEIVSAPWQPDLQMFCAPLIGDPLNCTRIKNGDEWNPVSGSDRLGRYFKV
jgi:hypothetical protein